MRCFYAAAVAAFVMLTALPGAAMADDGEPLYRGPAAIGGWGWGGWGGLPYGSFARDQYPPYFSLYPPVYYSYPVPRTYGYSPFAYPPGVITPSRAPALPQEMVNPHVEPSPAEPTSSRTALSGPVPQVVINPYVTQPVAANSQGTPR